MKQVDDFLSELSSAFAFVVFIFCFLFFAHDSIKITILQLLFLSLYSLSLCNILPHTVMIVLSLIYSTVHTFLWNKFDGGRWAAGLILTVFWWDTYSFLLYTHDFTLSDGSVGWTPVHWSLYYNGEEEDHQMSLPNAVPYALQISQSPTVRPVVLQLPSVYFRAMVSCLCITDQTCRTLCGIYGGTQSTNSG